MGIQPWPDGYESVKCIHRGGWGDVYTATQPRDGRTVVLKIFQCGEASRSHAQEEFEAMRACVHPGIPVAICLDLSWERACLVVERVPGVTLGFQVASGGPLAIGVVLDLATKWAEILGAVHRARFVHRDVTPNNLMLAPDSNEAHLIDFGIAATVGAGANAGALNANGAGTLLFIAPEQTGRMNRGCGFQSDLYGLGGSLYFALTGHPPFELENPLQLIHAHMAREPISPATLRPEIPEPLARLVLKLLAKEPGERYSSADSLCCDLRTLRAQWIQQGTLDSSFELEASEVPTQPRYPSKLFGRERESAILLEQLKQAIATGPRVVFVEGDVGAGKSALVDALRSCMGEVGGYMLQGQFDPFRERAYAGFVGCIEAFAQQVLVENDARLAEWRRTLRAAIGTLAGALTDWAPDLAAVLGEVPVLPSLGPRQTRARLVLSLQRFLTAVSSPAHPVVLFLDDFQYSDSESRSLFEDLFAGELSGSLLVILAHQNPRGAGSDLLSYTQGRLEELDVPVERLELGPLRLQVLVPFLEETFGKPAAAVHPLAELIERKTGGNPLWVRQLIDHLHVQECIRFEIGTGWCWDVDVIARETVPEGAAGLLLAKLEGLSPELAETLKWASCAGQVFGSELLATLGNTPQEKIERSLFELERMGVLIPAPEGFRFAHDRVHEAAKQRLSSEERADLHAKVASALLEGLTEDHRATHCLEVADHLVLAGCALPAALHATRLEWCLEAGRRVLHSGAARGAQRYLDAARDTFGESDWQSRQALGMGLWLVSAESAFQGGNPKRALELLDQVQSRIRTDLDRAQVETQRLLALSMVLSAEECTAYALRALRLWGVRLPRHPSWIRTWLVLRCGYRRILRRAKEGIHAPGGELSPKRLAGLMVFSAVGGVLSRTDVRLVALATAWVLQKPMPKHLAMREAYSVGHYGLWLQAALGDARRAAEVAAAAHSWMRQLGDTVYAPRLDANLRSMLYPIHMRRRRSLAAIDPDLERLAENGDVEYMYYGQFLKAYYGALGGESVSIAMRQLATVAATAQRIGSGLTHAVRCLKIFRWIGDDELPLTGLEEHARDAEIQLRNDGVGAEAWESTLWTLVLCIYRQHALSWRISELAQVGLFRCAPYAHVAHHLLYRGIAAAQLAETTRRRSYGRALRRMVKQLESWATFGPDYPHMLLLLQAEQARVAQRVDRANSLYEQAARGALAQEFVHHAALAKERRSELLLQSRRTTDGQQARQQAIELYERWGALPKVQELDAPLAHS